MPVAVNGCVVPAAIDAGFGDTVMEVSVGLDDTVIEVVAKLDEASPAAPAHSSVAVYVPDLVKVPVDTDPEVLLSVAGPGAAAGATKDVASYTYNAGGYLATGTDPLGQLTLVTAWDWRGAPTSATDLTGSSPA